MIMSADLSNAQFGELKKGLYGPGGHGGSLNVRSPPLLAPPRRDGRGLTAKPSPPQGTGTVSGTRPPIACTQGCPDASGASQSMSWSLIALSVSSVAVLIILPNRRIDTARSASLEPTLTPWCFSVL